MKLKSIAMLCGGLLLTAATALAAEPTQSRPSRAGHKTTRHHVVAAPAKAPSQWVDMGEGKMTDDILTCYELFNPVTYSVTVQKSVDVEGWYRILNPFASHPKVNSWAYCELLDGQFSILIDATDPDHVHIPASRIGVSSYDDELTLMSMSLYPYPDDFWYDEDEAAEMAGKLVDNVISFEVEDALVLISDYGGEKTNLRGAFRIELPEDNTGGDDETDVKLTLVVDNPEAVTAQYFDKDDNAVNRQLVSGENVFEVDADQLQRVYANNGYLIESCTDKDGGNIVTYESGRFVEFKLAQSNTYTITTTSDEALRSGSFTLTLDDPSAVVVVRAGDVLYGLKKGDNTVRFDEAKSENEITVRSADPSKALGDLSVNGESKGTKSSYTLTVADGDKVEVKAKAQKPVEDPVVTIKINDPDYIFAIELDYDEIDADFEDGVMTIDAKVGDHLVIYGDKSNFRLNAIYVNGEKSSSAGEVYSVNVSKDITIEFDVTRYGIVKSTIDVDDPANIKVMQGSSFSSKQITLKAGAQTFEFDNRNENNGKLTVSAQPDCRIMSITLNGEPVEKIFGSYQVILKGGEVLKIETMRIVRDKTVVVYREGSTLIDSFTFRFSDNTYKYGFDDGYTSVAFCNEDLPISCDWLSEVIDPGTGVVYLDDEVISSDDPEADKFSLNPDHNSVIKIFHNGAPAMHDLTFDVDEEAGDVTAVHDLVKPIADLTALTRLHAGSKVELTLGSPDAVKDVTLNGEPLAPQSDGHYEFTIKGASAVKVVSRNTSGISAITGDDCSAVEVYNLQGIRVTSDINRLPAGIYIIDGKKVSVNR